MEVLFLLCALLSLGLSQESCEQSPPPAKEKVWTIAIGHDWGGHEYMDTDGYLRGFNFDLIREVCSAANIQCRTIWDKYSNCWKSEAGQHSYGGQGLMDGWYDACTGWAGTIGRVQVFDFSMPFLKANSAYFFRKKGSSTSASDLTGKKIGFQDGYMSDEKCLARQSGIGGLPLSVDQVVHYTTTADMVTALNNNEVDLLFNIETAFDSSDVETIRDVGYQCALFGQAMMTRKDNEFNAHFNRGFQQIVSSGRFGQICQKAKDDHGDIGSLGPCV